jgi:hypothetical protein
MSFVTFVSDCRRTPDSHTGRFRSPIHAGETVHFACRFGVKTTRIPFVRLADLLISCARPRAPRSDAARPLPRLTMHSEEAICNGRDAVAQE